MITKKISPSIMCVDFFELDKYISAFENNGIDMIHVDIMDGGFVPNYTLGTDFVRLLKKKTNIPLDIHLMINNPESKTDWFEFGENDYVSVHCESTPHLHRATAAIRSRGAKAMVAINPGTPVSVLESIVDDIDAVLIMTVDPGFAGQKLIESTLKKIEYTRKWLDGNGHRNTEIEVDGNVSFENAKRMSAAGANIFVAGTSSIFTKSLNIEDSVKKLRMSISNNQ